MTQEERDNLILDRWAAGIPAKEIAREFNLSHTRISDIALDARAAGDPRAVKRRKAGSKNYVAVGKAMRNSNINRFRIRRIAAKFPSSAADLTAAITKSTIPVTKLPPGVHIGWRPSWLSSTLSMREVRAA